ncbi:MULTISPECIES: hypothetical protein [Rhizobium]|jgi:hypothetical protein|uniref:hypothetical protein n=1 Tax=Rhizobium TaxID=379 RepID=UPI000A47F52E|nr:MULTISPECIES: hypothetical protein [Rhizobium]QJX06185.1 hypothetical protein RLCC275e_14920 [Rhizobium brockwellii]TAY89035.1 hypothetical protein ELH83_15150 [Rhizobium leguminosarum]WSH22835.1 hypothetical protein U8Q07_11130 [Rhizobium ruizarguesonis]
MRKGLVEANDRREFVGKEKRAVVVNGKTEILPGDPFEIAKILAERRSKTPAAKAKARMAAEAKKRGL